MRPSIHTVAICTFILLFTFLSTPSSQAQKPQKYAVSDSKPPTQFGYTVRPILIPPPPVGPVIAKSVIKRDDPRRHDYWDTSPINPFYIGYKEIYISSFAINDNGEVAFTVIWRGNIVGKTWEGGVYTENRRIVSIGEVIAGKHIYDVSDVHIDNQGRVSYRAAVNNRTRQYIGNNPEDEAIFVERNLAIRGSPNVGKNPPNVSKDPWVWMNPKELFDHDGSIYLFHGLPSPGHPSFYTTDGITWYRSQSLPVVNPSDQPQEFEIKVQNDFPEKDLSEDVIQKMKVLDASRQPYGGDYSSIVKSSANDEKKTGPAGLLCYFQYYQTHGKKFPAYKANGLWLSLGIDFHGNVSPGFVGHKTNSKGQILFSIFPTPDDTRMYGLALATPTNAPEVSFSTVLTDQFSEEAKHKAPSPF